MKKRLISVLVLTLVMALGTFAHAEWVSLDGADSAPPQVTVRQEAVNRTVLDIQVPGFDVSTVDVNGSEYSQLRVPGHWFTLDRGQPELPFITSSLIIPDQGTPVVRVIKSDWQEIAANPVLPSKGNILRTENPADVAWAFDSIYRDGGTYPADVTEMGTPYIMRDYRGISLRVYPVRWDADRGVLLALKSMTVEVETNNNVGINERQPRIQVGVDPQFARLYRQGFDNYTQADKYDMLSTEGRMLIVCHDSFMGTIQPFVDWKRAKGMTVEVVSSGSLGGTTAGIQDAIDARYAAPEGLTYVIFVGDYAQIPTYSGTNEGADDDTRYANQEGSDLYPDLFVSRISATTPDHVSTQINKFIRYERDPEAGADWYHVAAGLASNEGSPPDYDRMEWLREDLLGYNFTFVDEIYQPTGTAADISAAVNEGRSLINYIGHGSGSSWSNPPFSTSNIHALSNGWKTPWIIDVACLNGDFSQTECFAEAWMRAGDPAQPDGAVAIYSASTSTPWVPPCVMQTEAIDLLVAEQANVIGSLYYHGIMKVMDEYPGNSQLVEQYNIFGDCSLVVRTDTPAEMTVAHAGVVALGASVFPIDVDVAGATVALYSDAGLHGVGVTDGSGHLDLNLDNPVVVGGDVTLTISGYNLLTQVETIQGIVPVVVDVQPASIPVGISTAVTVTLMDPPKTIENVDIYIEGYGVNGLHLTTDGTGIVTFNVKPAYGETLNIRGREIGMTYDMFNVDLPVTGAMDLTNPAISAEVPSIGMSDALTPMIEGMVMGQATEIGLTLTLDGCGLDTWATEAGNSVVLYPTPTEVGTVTAAITKSGYNVFAADIECVAAYGTLAGRINDADNGDAGIAGASVQIFAAGEGPGDTPLFDLTTDAFGRYEVEGDIMVANYELYVSKFGYLNHNETYFLMYGANDKIVAMNQAPSGVLTGTVTSVEDGSAVSGTVRVYRSDNGEMMGEVATDASGVYTTMSLPYFDYNVTVVASGFVPQSIDVSIVGPSLTRDFVLEVTIGNILVIDHNGTRGVSVFHAPKFGKNNEIVSPAYRAVNTRSTDDIVSHLTTFGYNVTEISSGAYDASLWNTFDLLILSLSNNTTDISAALATDLVTYASAGGRILCEGGELAYEHRTDDFAEQVLHISGWNHDSSGNVTVADPLHNIMSLPNTITGPIALTYVGYGDADAVDVAADAQLIGSWSSYDGDGSVIGYDPTPAPQAGLHAFFSFNYAALAADQQAELLQNAVIWLLGEEIGNSSISGTAAAVSGSNAGILVTLAPLGDSIVTGADGSFAFTDLTEGNYRVIASREGLATTVQDVELAEDENVTGINLVLMPTTVIDACSTPGLAIPDNNTTGVNDVLNVAEGSTISMVEAYLDITHTYIGDLTVELTSPIGTMVTLHARTGGTAEDIVTWYPSQTEPAESLDAFIGEDAMGDWILHVYDSAGSDLGTLNEWCLKITSIGSGATAIGDDQLPSVVTLKGNFPNPFNPSTDISFSLPKTQHVELSVYNVRGRRVTTLVNGVVEGGLQSVTWMGRDDAGRGVSSGTYFYRLVTDEGHQTGKMLLVK